MNSNHKTLAKEILEKYKNKPMFPESFERAKRLLENVIVVKGDQIEEILNQTSLETQFEIHLQMSDYENWENGEYLGDYSKCKKLAKELALIVKEWDSHNRINPILK